MESEQRKPWDRMDGEPAVWYRRFTELYLAQAGSRSLLEAVNQARDQKGQKRTSNLPGSWRAIAEAWQWRQRADLYDLEQSRQALQAWERRQLEQREREWDAASRLLEKAMQMLQFPLARVVKADGDRQTIINPADWRMADAAKLADTAAKLARLAAGMETDNIKVTWQDKVIELIRERKVTYEDVFEEYGPDLATDLFRRAGVPVEQGGQAGDQGGGPAARP